MIIPQPLRFICLTLTIFGIFIFLFGVAENSIVAIIIGLALGLVFGALIFFWGFPDEE